jgi:predicted RNase H-like nuclease
MAVSRVGDRNLTLPERRSLSTSPWDLEAEILTLRQQLNVLQRKAPKRVAFSTLDHLVFASLYWIAPGVVNALVIVKPETGGFWLVLAMEVATSRRQAKGPARNSPTDP